MEDIETETVAEGVRRSSALAALTAWTGAATSAALIGGLIVWGWQLAVRDVSEVPVIRAAQEPMRVAPESPGGERAPHQGLTVNKIAEDVAAEPPVEVALAPASTDLNPEDVAPVETASTLSAADTPAPPPPPQIAATDLAVAEALGLSSDAMLIMASARSSVLPAAAPEDSRAAPRPAPRPAAAARQPSSEDVASASTAAGLVHLGAYGSADEARAAWTRIANRFGDDFAGKERVVQEAMTAGQAFWRLRAAGFVDLADARRFCSALNAGDAECIPVVVR